ncbi:sensor histidine kinase [Paenibacillus sp. sgz5001063]|uniref:sensor histidine kinase n=1 Tax=Paenibacillus sp. sgz5001063 TaxID=3242474 RepID=UPI0036D3DA35
MVGIWEIVRHQFLMPYLSMNMGNYLTPVLVFLFSIVLLVPLFSLMEKNARELEQERVLKTAMEAREALARELHDGMAQSLFLLSVRIDRLEQKQERGEMNGESIRQLKKTVHEVNRYVRQAISNLKVPVAGPQASLLMLSVQGQLAQIADEVSVEVALDWNLREDIFSAAEQVELLACIREAMVNVRKHTRAGKVAISGREDGRGWRVGVSDDGAGIRHEDPFAVNGSYGLQIMKERVESMGWTLTLKSGESGTTIEIAKGGDSL